MYRAWMASVDTDRNGTVGPDRFYQATKKIGYGGDLPALFKSLQKLGCTARSGKLYRARSRLYRSQILQVNMRLKALAEIYTMHSFAPLQNQCQFC